MKPAHDAAREQFSKAADAYVTSAIHARGSDLDWLMEWAGPVRGLRVLDIACGGGHTALRFARAGAAVTVTDLTPAVLEAARGFIRGEGCAVRYVLAPAEHLPFEAEAFAIVTCRIAAHHFGDISQFGREVSRVLRPRGRFFLIDNIAPEDPELDRIMNWVEATRDPSHVRAYRVSQWVQALAAARLEPFRLIRFSRAKEFRDWVARSQTPASAIAAIEACIRDLPPRARAYLGVVEEGGRLVGLSHEVILAESRKGGPGG